jgi:hypothetical protein
MSIFDSRVGILERTANGWDSYAQGAVQFRTRSFADSLASRGFEFDRRAGFV